MADHGPSISLSQGRDFSQTSDEEFSEHSVQAISPVRANTISSAVPFGAAGVVGSSTPVSKLKKSPPSSNFISDQKISSPSSTALVMVDVSTSKKPRGRPPGSKNKPKPPIVITKEIESAMKPVIIEISSGCDVVECLVNFARKRHVGITVLSGSGSISTVTLRHPISHAPALSLDGPFSLLSLSGSYVSTLSSKHATSSSSSSSAPPSSCSSFGICLAGAQGQVFGGIVGGKVVAASLVVVMVSTFMNPSFHRLPDEADEAEDTKQSIGGSHVIEGGCTTPTPTTTTTNAMSRTVYSTVPSPNPLNCHVPTDAMPWSSHSSRPPY